MVTRLDLVWNNIREPFVRSGLLKVWNRKSTQLAKLLFFAIQGKKLKDFWYNLDFNFEDKKKSNKSTLSQNSPNKHFFHLVKKTSCHRTLLLSHYFRISLFLI